MAAKLTAAERRYLKALAANRGIFFGTCDTGVPKHTHITTVRNLYRKGLIEHAGINFYSCPMRMSDAGKKVLSDERQAS